VSSGLSSGLVSLIAARLRFSAGRTRASSRGAIT
jgi:hypothetical protein